ncbi:coiled-coil domain-containing protein 85C isoform X2 [Neocloeon triangulifer]|uniref:coiled-coil domain-containing protein 85C isoform X2 n=1 Tax=Neocloeon triangulifer TaxID=2078957 RepID=UPI00286F9A3E|nr:coiled-coil domain-containing protein 85C isoform X2 [Neocloeon triangulifer]
MLPKRQTKPEMGPPKYQPPPQVTKPSTTGADTRPQQPSKIKEVVARPASTGLLQDEIIRPVSPSRGPMPKRAVDDLMVRPGLPNHMGNLERPAWRPMSDEELLHRPPQEMLRIVRAAESEMARLQSEHGQWVQDARTRLQTSANELRSAQDLARRLQDDNQELRDLCCFLDDDRQKGRKLAREWQRFGRYTASVMRQEVSSYQGKLRELDNRQHELIRDNLELKELCLYLDEERNSQTNCPSCGASLRPGTRDDGDGSSSSTNADEPNLPVAPNATPAPQYIHRSESRDRLMEDSITRQRNTFNDQLVGYIRSLEQRVVQMEDERRALQTRLTPGSTDQPVLAPNRNQPMESRPEAVVHALQVLQVREQLERSNPSSVPQVAPPVVPPPPPQNTPISNINLPEGPPDLDDGEKALVREMCNVVWRKLEEAPAINRR